MDAPTNPKRRANWVFSDILRKGLKYYYEWSARLRGQRFYCNALAGESEYNLTINCDLTVSCNCQDYNGSGHLGDLNKNSFEEIFFGPVARRFREEMAKGKLPIKSCTRCGDLMILPKADVKTMANLRALAKSRNGAAKTEPSSNGQVATAGDTTPELFAGPIPRLPYRGMLLEN